MNFFELRGLVLVISETTENLRGYLDLMTKRGLRSRAIGVSNFHEIKEAQRDAMISGSTAYFHSCESRISKGIIGASHEAFRAYRIADVTGVYKEGVVTLLKHRRGVEGVVSL